MKKSVLNDAIKDAKDTSSASNDITDTAASAAASAIDAIPKSDDIYVFGIGVAAVPAICVFGYNKKSCLIAIKEQIMGQQQALTPPERRSVL